MILLPNFLTALNLFFGSYAITILIQGGSLDLPCALVFLCAIFDGLDGALARKLKMQTEFGKYFDSAADFVSFGLVPALITLSSNRTSTSVWINLSASLYIFCSLFRLIRFLAAHRTSKTTGMQPFEGLPITASAVCFAIFSTLFRDLEIKEILYPVLLLTLSGLMASRVTFHRPSFTRLRTIVSLSIEKNKRL